MGGISHGDANFQARQGRDLVTTYWRRQSNVDGARWAEIIDFLRSNSYDCGYGVILSLIDAGIAMELSPEETKQSENIENEK